MMKLRKLRLTLAVSAVLGATALIPATSFGWSVDTDQGVLDTLSGGDTLLFPIYTTVTPATTSFSTTNTSGQTIVAKIRFREQERSMDVLDFLVVYSPYDKFDFYVEQAEGAARPTMKWNDNSCVIGPGTGGSVDFPAPSPFVSGDETMSVGHLEVLGMGDLTGIWVDAEGGVFGAAGTGRVSLAAAAEHGPDGVPLDCNLLVRWLSSQNNVAALNAAVTAQRKIGDVGNVLVGRYLITGQGLGIEAGSDAVSIQNSDLGWPTSPITSQSGSDCSDSTNCVQSYAWDGLEWDHPHLGEMVNLINFQTALTAQNVAGDWSNNPANFVGLDWILSFPNKYAYLDLVDGAVCDGGAGAGTKEWCLLNATKTGNGQPGVWTTAGFPFDPTVTPAVSQGTTNLCLNDNDLAVWDTEEQEASGNVSVSPGTRTTLDICNELQVFTLAPVGSEPRPSVIQTAERRGVIGFENLDAIRGWGRMDLNWPAVVQGMRGDSIVGGIFTTRNTDDPTINNASLTDLQKGVGGGM
jgi:hypothetical protein